MTKLFEGEITEISRDKWAGVEYGVLKLKLNDGSVLELGFNHNTKGPNPVVGVKAWVTVSDTDPPFILKLSSPDLNELASVTEEAPKQEVKKALPVRLPEYIGRPLGVQLISIYIVIMAIVFFLMPGATSFYRPYGPTFYIISIVCTILVGYLWQMKKLARWLSVPLLAIFVLYFWFLSLFGILVITMSSLSVIYLLHPRTSTYFEAYDG